MPRLQLGQITLCLGLIQRQDRLARDDLLALAHEDLFDATAALMLHQLVLAIADEGTGRDYGRSQREKAERIARQKAEATKP